MDGREYIWLDETELLMTYKQYRNSEWSYKNLIGIVKISVGLSNRIPARVFRWNVRSNLRDSTLRNAGLIHFAKLSAEWQICESSKHEMLFSTWLESSALLSN